ncbi:glycosyltransferase family 90 protein [Xylona heveae TC161]|uniref:Glycosyltransferase family 90 protein n=1 Tax=Xylona heveae (strain CBS 132557 / TC161) TaxID=1328760 RepID=A0A165JWW8_XYLHT|nr:glycosyltransferase family 90 protein [Xylona heveae TC161]KZF26727.1 glycosyltransferase family 90 protein [Xylona heveae TC161]
MSKFDNSKQRLFLLIAFVGCCFILLNVFVLFGVDRRFSKVPLELDDGQSTNGEFKVVYTYAQKDEEPLDNHPISELMKRADEQFRQYDDGRSKNFREAVRHYRNKYGRHPPPGFREWYQYARDRNVYNIDDFDQAMDDLRPFWGVEPKVIRNLAAHMWEKTEDGISGIHIRNHKVVNSTNPGWRSDTFITLIDKISNDLPKILPDMDIAMNRLDQPRIVVPWEDMQALLATEEKTRHLPPEGSYEFTPDLPGLAQNIFNPPKSAKAGDPTEVEKEEEGEEKIEDPAWFRAPGKQYMDIGKLACPPESHARDSTSTEEDSELLYKTHEGGLVTNFNRSSDLCTIGPEIQNKHGFLYSSSSLIASKRLLPVFGECKVNVNSDILFPANMYWKHDDRYDYSEEHDLPWEDKYDQVVWRGVTSGGVQLESNWQRMHRQRLVQLLNSTQMADKDVRILAENPERKGEYENVRTFQPSEFAEKHTDVGFVETWGCVPNCDFYKDVFALKEQTTLSSQFKYRYLIDVDGHSFSGRWRAFLESKSLGFKATIFREWHDSRLFAWRHFVPMDNRFDDVYTLLTYFIGTGIPSRPTLPPDGTSNKGDIYVPRHEYEAKMLARRSREWAKKVLRRDDIAIYTLRLLLEYGRLIDDNRDRIGYFGDGSELDDYDSKHPMPDASEGLW